MATLEDVKTFINTEWTNSEIYWNKYTREVNANNVIKFYLVKMTTASVLKVSKIELYSLTNITITTNASTDWNNIDGTISNLTGSPGRDVINLGIISKCDVINNTLLLYNADLDNNAYEYMKINLTNNISIGIISIINTDYYNIYAKYKEYRYKLVNLANSPDVIFSTGSIDMFTSQEHSKVISSTVIDVSGTQKIYTVLEYNMFLDLPNNTVHFIPEDFNPNNIKTLTKQNTIIY